MSEMHDHSLWLDAYERWWAKTENPLFVWNAIACCLNSEPPLPIPAWCLPYLTAASRNMNALAEGRDFRGDYASLPPGRAYAAIHAALGLSSGQGKKNAFVRLAETDYEQRRVLDSKYGHDAAETIQRDHNVSPERAGRILRKAKKGWGQG